MDVRRPWRLVIIRVAKLEGSHEGPRACPTIRPVCSACPGWRWSPWKSARTTSRYWTWSQRASRPDAVRAAGCARNIRIPGSRPGPGTCHYAGHLDPMVADLEGLPKKDRQTDPGSLELQGRPDGPPCAAHFVVGVDLYGSVHVEIAANRKQLAIARSMADVGTGNIGKWRIPDEAWPELAYTFDWPQRHEDLEYYFISEMA